METLPKYLGGDPATWSTSIGADLEISEASDFRRLLRVGGTRRHEDAEARVTMNATILSHMVVSSRRRLPAVHPEHAGDQKMFASGSLNRSI
jgi:hypothetical protein